MRIDQYLKLRTHELAELEIIGGLARRNIFKKIAEGGGTIIENTAVLDRVFQQKQLLGSNQVQSSSIDKLCEVMQEQKKLKDELDYMKDAIDVTPVRDEEKENEQ